MNQPFVSSYAPILIFALQGPGCAGRVVPTEPANVDAAPPSKVPRPNRAHFDCTSDADCADDSFCKQVKCGSQGTCVQRPDSCPADAGPALCTCKGVYYASACDADMDGRSVTDVESRSCLSTGQCGDWQVHAKGDCETSLGWIFAPDPVKGMACRELVGCHCASNVDEHACSPDTPFYGSFETCARAHTMCGY